MKRSLVALALLFVLVAEGLVIQVPPSSEQCVFEQVRAGEKVIGSYEVSQGGNLDIDLKVRGLLSSSSASVTTTTMLMCFHLDSDHQSGAGHRI